MVSACQVGEVIAVKQADGRYEEAVVRAACQDKENGHWYCAAHREHFRNQFMKDVQMSERVMFDVGDRVRIIKHEFRGIKRWRNESH